MSNQHDDGGPAFPVQTYAGMSLRDWFAGQALAGLLASGHFTHHDEDDGPWMIRDLDPYDDETGEELFPHRRRFAFPEAAWRCADAMLAERNRRNADAN